MQAVQLTTLSEMAAVRLRQLFSTLPTSLLQVDTSLAGRTSSTLYVDSISQPCAAALQHQVCWYIVGALSDNFADEINAQLPRDTYVVLVLGTGIESAQRARLLRGLYFVSAKSRYAVRETPTALTHTLPAGYRLEPANQDLLSRDLEGVQDLRESLEEDWQSLDNYLQHGFGFVVVHHDKIVSHSLADYVYDDRCEIGVHTDSAHRRKGLGTCVATATANEAFVRGMQYVGWMSWANNAGSIAISQRAGFVERCTYDVFINHWPAENPNDLTRDEYRAFAMAYESQFQDKPPADSGYPYFVAATAWALSGERERCRAQLHRAIDMGWLRSRMQLQELWPELFEIPGILAAVGWDALFARLVSAADADDHA